MSAVAAPAPRSFALPRGVRTLALRVAAGIVLLVLWELLVRWLAAPYVARPTGVAKVLPDVLSNKASTTTALTGLFWSDVKETLVAVFEGLVIGVVLGTFVGLAMGRLRDLDALLRFYVSAFFALPTIAVLPLMTLWFGYSGTARLAIIILGSFLPVVLNVYDGVRKLPPTYLEVARTYHARWWNVWFGIALPASVPYLLAGVRLAAGRALVGAVVAEYLLAVRGLGYYIRFAASSFHQNEATVAVLMLAVVGVTINVALDTATRRFLPWFRRTA